MAMEHAIVTGYIDADLNDETNFTSSGFGTPDAAIIIVNQCVSGSDTVAHAVFSWGFWDGTSDQGAGFVALDNQATTQEDCGHNAYGYVVPTNNLGGWRNLGAVTNITDGIKITETDGSSTTIRAATVILLKGVTNAYVGTYTMDGTTNTQDITAPGFKPDVVLFGCSINLNSEDAGVVFGMGVAHNDSSDTVTQGCTGYSAYDAQSYRTKCGTAIGDGSCLIRAHPDGTTIIWTIAASAFDSSGFSLTPTNSNTSGVYYLALELADPDDAAVIIGDTKDTSTGTKAYTGTGFTPDLLMTLPCMATAVDTRSAEGFIGVGVSDNTTEQSITISNEDSALTSNSQSDRASAVINTVFGDGTADSQATVDSFDSDGFTLDFTDYSTTARKFVAIAFGDSAGGGGGGPTFNGITSYTNINGITSFTNVNGQT